MNCQNCREPVEDTAIFCGNCGQQLHATPAVMRPTTEVPTYALAQPSQHIGETQALLSILLGVVGIVGALFMPLIGLALALFGLVMGSLSRNSVKRSWSTAGLVISSIALVSGLAVWTYAVQRNQRVAEATQPTQSSTPATLVSSLSTPCYAIGFTTQLKVSNYPTSCDMSAFNGQSLDTSTTAYKVYANQTPVTSNEAFQNLAKRAIEKDVRDNLPGFVIENQRATTFAGSPAYIVNASDPSRNIAMVEAAVWRQTSGGDNVFVLVHAINGTSASLTDLETQWQWK